MKDRRRPPDLFLRERRAAERAIAAAAAASTGIFRLLADEAADASTVARELSLDQRAVEIVLEALVESAYLEREGEGYRPSEAARVAFHSSRSLGGIHHWLHLLEAWVRLPDVLRAGGPVDLDSEESEEEARERFMGAMAAQPTERAREVARRLRRRCPSGERALDLGGGPGVYARALAGEGFRVTVFDRPEVVEHVRGAFDLEGLEGVELAAGDFLEDPLPEGSFATILLSNITHIYDPDTNRGLLRKVRRSLEPGGVAGVFDVVRGRSPLAARLAVTMLLRTEGGGTYTEAEYRTWMEEAGLAGIEVEDVEDERQLITGKAV